MPDTADTIARDMIAEVGRLAAIGYVLGRVAERPSRMRQGMALLVAVIVV